MYSVTTVPEQKEHHYVRLVVNKYNKTQSHKRYVFVQNESGNDIERKHQKYMHTQH